MSSAEPAVKLRALLGGRAPAPAETRPSLDDSQLLRALHEGDVQAAGQICKRLTPRVRGTVMRLLGPADVDCADVVQNSMVEIVRCVGQFRGESSLESWASGVAAKVVYKHVRRRRLERRVFAPVAPETSSDSNVIAIDVSRQVAARRELERVFAQLAALDEDKVLAYLLHDVCGFDLREVAGIVGVSVAAAQSRLVRGRRLVHEALGKGEGT